MGAAPVPSRAWGDVAGPRGRGEAGQHGAGLGSGMLLLQSAGLSWEQPGAPRWGAVGGRGWWSLSLLSAGGSLGRSFPRRLGCEEHQPARDPSQHQHRRHQHQSAQPVAVHVSIPRWGGAAPARGLWPGLAGERSWAPLPPPAPAPSGSPPVRRTVDPACCRGAWAGWQRGGSGDGAQRGWGGAACLPVTPDLGSVLLSGLPTRRVAFLPLPPRGCAASLLAGEEPIPASPGTTWDSWL